MQRSYRPFFFGARQWAIENFKKLYPGPEVSGFRNGYYTADEEPGIAHMSL